MTTTPALQAVDSATFEAVDLPLPEVGPHDVLIDVAWCGICHTDLHYVHDDWGNASYPLTPGHEIAGTVAAVGSEVRSHRVGDSVGVGCLSGSCGSCRECQAGDEQFCRTAIFTYNTELPDGSRTKGGYAQQMVIDEHFVLSIPASLPLDQAAPLLCAGVTTYSPLKRWGAGPGRRVGIIGLGGLGHLGVQIAAAMGAEVTVLSRTDAKSEDSTGFGAGAHVATAEEGWQKQHRGEFDLILNTVGAAVRAADYLTTLRPRGAFVTVGLGDGESAIEPGRLVHRDQVIAGSLIGGIAITQEMLDFCAEHGIGARVEHLDVSDPAVLLETYQRIDHGGARYRVVIDTATIPGTQA